MKWFFRTAAAAAGTGALTLCAVYGIYRYIFYSPVGKQNDDYHILAPIKTREQFNRAINLIRAVNRRPYEAVRLRSRDGLQLTGRYYHTRDGAPLAILCHGYRGTPSRDFCGGADILFQSGFNVLLIEERAHCSSEGHTISFGINERYDVRDWISYSVERFGKDVRILLAGISMGAATVLMASELDLSESIRGILADCPYTSPCEIIAQVGKRMHIPSSVSIPLAKAAAQLFGHFSLDASSAVSAIRSVTIPILLIHGEADDFVPCSMSRAIAAANTEYIELHTFPEAGHGLSYLVDTERYTKLVEAFCDRLFS